MLKGKKLHKDSVIKSFLPMLAPLRENIDEIYLFGSRCRDDWRPDSDYDILIVVKKKDKELVGRFYDAVIDILLGTGKLISLKIFTISEFNRLRSIPTPFMHHIIREGIKLGSHD